MLSLSVSAPSSNPGIGLTHIGLKEKSSEQRIKLGASSIMSSVSGWIAINIAFDPSVQPLGVMRYAITAGLLILAIKSVRDSRQASKIADQMEEILESSIAQARGIKE